jgi:hypothetical protein
MNIDVTKDVVGSSTVDEWKKGEYSGGPVSFVLNTDHIVHMEDITLKTYPTTLVTLSDDRIVILAGTLEELKKKFHIR